VTGEWEEMSASVAAGPTGEVGKTTVTSKALKAAKEEGPDRKTKERKKELTAQNKESPKRES